MMESTTPPNPRRWPTRSPDPIVIVGPNPAMDRLEVVNQLEPGAVHRVRSVHAKAGGKSFIVARSVRALGPHVEMLGFLGGAAGDLARAECRDLSIHDRHTTIAADTRITAVIVESITGRSTVFNEPGPPITDAEQQSFWSELQGSLAAERIIACTGSIPPDLPHDSYARIVSAANSAGAYAAVDSNGKVLRAALRARPWLVKCNWREFLSVLPDDVSSAVESTHDIHQHVAAFIATGISILIVTMGPNNFLVATEDGLWSVTVPTVTVVNATGSGDTFFAAFLATARLGGTFAEALAAAAAGGAANAAQLEPGLTADADLSPLTARVQFAMVSPTPTGYLL